MGKLEEKEAEAITQLIEVSLTKLKIPFLNTKKLGLDKLSLAIMKISQRYVEAKIDQAIDKIKETEKENVISDSD